MTTLTTSRLSLRPPRAADRAAMVQGLGNINVSRWTGRIPHPYGLEDADSFLSYCQGLDETDLVLAIALQGDVIGMISLEKGELGYWLAEPHWRKGYGREAADAMVSLGFGTLALERLTASYHAGNEASRRLLLGLGFAEIGEATGFSLASQQEVRLINMDLTRAAWRASGERQR